MKEEEGRRRDDDGEDDGDRDIYILSLLPETSRPTHSLTERPRQREGGRERVGTQVGEGR